MNRVSTLWPSNTITLFVLNFCNEWQSSFQSAIMITYFSVVSQFMERVFCVYLKHKRKECWRVSNWFINGMASIGAAFYRRPKKAFSAIWTCLCTGSAMLPVGVVRVYYVQRNELEFDWFILTMLLLHICYYIVESYTQYFFSYTFGAATLLVAYSTMDKKKKPTAMSQ